MRKLLLSAAGIVLLVVIAVVVLSSGANNNSDPKVQITVPLPGPNKVIQADKDNQLEPGEQKEAADAGIDLHEDTRDETPPGVSPAQLEAGKKATAEQAKKELVTPEKPGGAQNYSCRKHPVVNQSALTQRRVGVALHFTVSDPGSLTAIHDLFNRPSFGASSNYGFELYNLKCEQWVPESRKAWAQMAANSAYVSIEIISKDRSRSSWLASPAFKNGTLAALVRDIMRRQGSPLRHVNPSGCVWTPGIVDHDALECGNNHWDVGKAFPWDVFMRQVKAGVSPAPLTKAQSRACSLLQFHRRRAHEIGRWFPSRAARANELKKLVPTGRCKSKYVR